MLDHTRLFTRLFDALEPGGRLEAQCGGAATSAAFHDAVGALADRPPFAEYFADWAGPWYFADARARQRSALERTGFTDVRCWLEDRPVVRPEPHDVPATVCLGPTSSSSPTSFATRSSAAVVDTLGSPLTLDYVRLNISARRPG